VAQLPESLSQACQVEALPFQRQADRRGQLRQLMREMQERGESGHVIGLYIGGDTFWRLAYGGSSRGLERGDTDPTDVHTLDVSLLHETLLEKILGLHIPEEGILYTQDEMTAVDLVARQEYQVAFLLNPTKVGQVMQYAMTGRRMPRKSTYFFPKLLTGIVMHKEVGDADQFG
jgi:uncharacterized protein (DUF1015 family)